MSEGIWLDMSIRLQVCHGNCEVGALSVIFSISSSHLCVVDAAEDTTYWAHLVRREDFPLEEVPQAEVPQEEASQEEASQEEASQEEASQEVGRLEGVLL
jgi:hypothetical protein